MKRFVFVLAIGFVMSGVFVEGAVAKEVDVKLFSGGKTLVVVNGYSTSFKWPAMLQRKLNRYFEGEDRVEVVSALKGGTPIAKWMNVESGAGLKPWGEILIPALKAKGERKVLVLCQQSLQWAFGTDRTAGIDSANDAKDIKRGATVIGRYVDLLKKSGADGVVIAMHIYKHPMEPAIGNERLALAKFLGGKVERERKDVWAGPDVWEPTKAGYPQLFAGDKVHPNSVGAELMAHLWFESLLKREGLAAPGWSLAEYEAAKKEGVVEEVRGGGARNGRSGGGGGDRANGLAPFVLRRYDKDGDGKLNEEERTVFEAAKKARSEPRS